MRESTKVALGVFENKEGKIIVVWSSYKLRKWLYLKRLPNYEGGRQEGHPKKINMYCVKEDM